MIASATEAEPLTLHLAAVFAIAIFSALIWGAKPAATAFALAGLDRVIVSMLCAILAVPVTLAIALVGRLPMLLDGRYGNGPFWRQRRQGFVVRNFGTRENWELN